MSRQTHKGTWSLNFTRDSSPGVFDSDGTIVIHESNQNEDYHYNAHEDAGSMPFHKMMVTFLPTGGIHFQRRTGADPRRYKYLSLTPPVTVPIGGATLCTGRVTVKKRGRPKDDEEEGATWVATQKPGPLEGKDRGPSKPKKAVAKKAGAKRKSK